MQSPFFFLLTIVNLWCIIMRKTIIRSRGQGEPINEESPSVLETGCRRNPGEGDFKESATENNRHFGKDEKVR